MAATDRIDTRAPWWAYIGVVMAGGVLCAFGVAYYLTYEPAPRIGVRWRDGLAAERRADLERRFLLVNPRPSGGEFTYYDLLDTRPENVEALVREPDAFDTESIGRMTFTVPPDVTYGQSWMWMAHRNPRLREPGVVEAIVGASLLVLAVSVWRLARAWGLRRRKVRSVRLLDRRSLGGGG